MARPLRIEFPGAWYHVMNRGARRSPTYLNDKDRTTFLNLLNDIVETFHIEVHAYCLMTNHYHLLIHTPHGNLGQAMRHLNGVYTQRFNFRHRLDGPLFRGRYKAILVDADTYLTQVSRYIHLNPVESKTTTDPSNYPWSSARYFSKDVKAPPWLKVNATLEYFGKRGAAKESYAKFLSAGVDALTREFYGKPKQGPILGDEAFRKKLPSESNDDTNNPEIPEKKFLHQQVPMTTIFGKVAEAYGLPVDELFRSGRGRRDESIPRMVAMALCRRPGGHALKAIGEAVQSTYSAVSAAGIRLTEKIQTDPTFAKHAQSLIANIFNNQFKT
ncbi:MAG: transposase [Elusimicrobia bacterium]|jgi:putative transposase|nr:transposase [Elusimicrobiota bacterium]